MHESATKHLKGNRRNYFAPKGIFRFPVAGFLGALLLLMLASPFTGNFTGSAIVDLVLVSMVLLSAVLAVSGRRRMLIGSVLALIPFLAGWGSHIWPGLAFAELFRVSGLFFLGFVIWELLRYIMRAPRVDSEVLCAGVAIYLLLGLFWSFAYVLVGHWIPDSFAYTVGPAATHSMEGFNALYFSFTTLSTVGFGDIIPVSKVARMLAMLEAIAGLFYVTLLIARLVSLYTVKASVKMVSDEVAGIEKDLIAENRRR